MPVDFAVQDKELSQYLLDCSPVCVGYASANAMQNGCICRKWPTGHVVVRHQQQIGSMLLEGKVTGVGDIVAPIEWAPGIGHLASLNGLPFKNLCQLVKSTLEPSEPAS